MVTRLHIPIRPHRLALAAILVLVPSAALAQLPPTPTIPDVRERSGLYTRIVPIEPHLPVDKKRDTWYDTQWQPRHRHFWGRWANSFKDGGLYGNPLPGDCTVCRYPHFRGSPGGKFDPSCEPPHRLFRFPSSLLIPFRPVDSYYAGGCYVPVYDLDPLVPGPGWYPFWPPDFANWHIGH